MKNILFALVLCSVLCSCATGVKEIDNKLTATDNLGDSKIGITENGGVVIQEESHANVELISQRSVNEMLRYKVDSERSSIIECHDELIIMGKMKEIQDLAEAGFPSTSEVEEEFGLINGNLKFVKKTDYIATLKAERAFDKRLRAMHQNFKKHRLDCERKLKIERALSSR